MLTSMPKSVSPPSTQRSTAHTCWDLPEVQRRNRTGSHGRFISFPRLHSTLVTHFIVGPGAKTVATHTTLPTRLIEWHLNFTTPTVGGDNHLNSNNCEKNTCIRCQDKKIKPLPVTTFRFDYSDFNNLARFPGEILHKEKKFFYGSL